MNKQTTNKRKIILESALGAFARYGFENATIKQIAAEAGLSTTSLIYWYFKDKDDLFKAVLKEFSPLLTISSDPKEIREHPAEEVLTLIGHVYLDTFENPDMVQLFRILLSELSKKPEIGLPLAQNGIMVVLDFISEYLQYQVHIGKMKPHDSLSIARAFMGTLVSYILMRELIPQTHHNMPEKEQYLREVITVFLGGLRT